MGGSNASAIPSQPRHAWSPTWRCSSPSAAPPSPPTAATSSSASRTRPVTPTQLTSPTTNAAGALKVTSTASSGGRAIQGTSAHGQGVYGHSGSNAGVVGDSNTFDGVFGVSNDTDSAGVSGHGDGGGYGLFATGGSRLFHTAAIHGAERCRQRDRGLHDRGPRLRRLRPGQQRQQLRGRGPLEQRRRRRRRQLERLGDAGPRQRDPELGPGAAS